MDNFKMWRKFYECSCHTEGIMIGYEDIFDGIPVVDLAFFNNSLKFSRELTFIERLKWCWYIITKGIPYLDMVVLNQQVAKELGNDLLKFANKKYKMNRKGGINGK